MDVVLQYFDGCPNWIEAQSLINEALDTLGEEAELIEQRIETLEDAVAVGFAGSPTILINGSDPFAVDGAEPRLACRVYPTPDGLRGTPTVNQLIAALTAAKQSR